MNWNGKFTFTDRKTGLIVATFENTLTQVGRHEVYAKYFDGTASSTTWYIGLILDGGLMSFRDTMTEHGWTEFEGYTPGSRPLWDKELVVGGVVENNVNKANIVITEDASIQGAFLCDDNVIGDTAGILLSLVSRGSPLGVTIGQEFDVTYAVF